MDIDYIFEFSHICIIYKFTYREDDRPIYNIEKVYHFIILLIYIYIAYRIYY